MSLKTPWISSYLPKTGGSTFNLMPYKPAHPCKYPGCPGLTHTKYCEKHSYLEHQADKQYNASRSAEEKERYHSEWRRIRDRFLIDNPFCAVCRKQGKLVKATMVHHIRPLSEGGDNDESNLVGLCYKCHSQTHGKRGDYSKKKVYTYQNT